MLSGRTLNNEMTQQMKRAAASQSPSESSQVQSPGKATPANLSIDVWVNSQLGRTAKEEIQLDLYELCHPILVKKVLKPGKREKILVDVKRALEQHVDPNRWRGPSTPLHGAQKSGDILLVTLLLDKRATVNAADSKGVAPLHNSAYDGQMEITSL